MCPSGCKGRSGWRGEHPACPFAWLLYLKSLDRNKDFGISNGATDKGDGWVDAKGMFLAEAGANEVYRLLGAKGLGTDMFPPMLTPLTGGALAFRQHDEGHTPTPNYPIS